MCVGTQRAVRVTAITTEMPTLLQCVTVLGILGQDAVKTGLRLCDVALKPVADRRQVETVAICPGRIRREKCQRAGEIPDAHARANSCLVQRERRAAHPTHIN